MLFTYQIGGKVYDAGYQGLMGGAEYGDAIHKDALNRWQQPGDITDVPRLDIANNANSGATSDRWLTSGTHLNLRQITLDYQIPMTLLNKLKIASKRDGMNVIQNFSGVTSNAYIPSRIISVGLNVGI